MGDDVKLTVSMEDKTEAAAQSIENNLKDVGDAAKKTDESIGKMPKTNRDTSMSWTELASKVNLAMMAIEAVGNAAKDIYEFGKAGAELDYVSTRFDRLTASIGTTSDVLLKDLREATKGTRSDMDLMAGAADLVGLGLAKNREQVVRLSNVVGGLGMDMNQLVLTLTNQTTARFDQLGVSVDGFDEKVKQLEQTGLDTNAAFTEAFLQQAEEQLTKVGNKADESIGSFQRFEANLQNLSDQAKREAAPALAQLVDQLNKVIELSIQNQGTLDGITGGYGRVAAAAQRQTLELIGMTDAEKKARAASQANREAQLDEASAIENASKKMNKQRETIRESATLTDRMAESYEGAGRAAANYAQHVEFMDGKIKNASTAIEQQQRVLEDLTRQQENWAQGVGQDLGSMLEDANLANEDYEEALAAVDDQTGTNLLNEKRLKEAQKALVAEFKKTGDVNAFRTALGNLNRDFDPFKSKLAEARTLLGNLKNQLDLLNGSRIVIDVEVNTPGGGGSSGTGESCFAPGTPVNTPDGYRPVEDITVGDYVSLYTDDGEVVPVRVKRLIYDCRYDMVRVELSTGMYIISAPNHSFMTLEGWVHAEALEPGTLLRSPDGEVYVVAVMPQPGTYPVHNFEVDHTEHTFMVASVVVHNAEKNFAGGPVVAGGAYMVGEHGPEMFYPQTNGAVASNTTTNYILNAYHTQAPDVVKRGWAMERALAGRRN